MLKLRSFKHLTPEEIEQAAAKQQLAIIRLSRAGIYGEKNMALLMMYAENGADMDVIIAGLKEDQPSG